MYDFIRLETKPTARLCYSFSPATTSTTEQTLVVFVNGLGLPQAGWASTIARLRELSPQKLPAILTYDRFGQGQSVDRDPADEGAADPSHAHDCMSVVRDMRQLIAQIAKDKMNAEEPDNLRIVFVGNSVGCSLIRLYAQEYPNVVAGILFLDSTLTDTDFVSLFPDPDAKSFDPNLPPGVTAESLRDAREKIRQRFHPDVGSQEGLSRRNLFQLLPRADSPPLYKAREAAPYIQVLGHDFEFFAERAEMDLGIPVAVIQIYMNTYWHRYNQGLAKLTMSERSKGPFQVPGAGHFIQADNPSYVAERLHEMLQLLEVD
ncbi:uncharacterized protein NECHADRAFT_52191 [Fusarium vanettenii 77-13-4]|uniref:AB hydrolase-1 domain-containing protein n=1 Tax=Fusarium vanettenii (strain ATCC MYA-4622 / CBS 123669 / FGSC 9596 / NRRL 45880 / 77-13-4) TaxID=660122 RepID=C7ZFT4_FUSV7|nr:uncharacterized protein NECHADRAFT_52191 [Fusarium vanettenii 77-13-4]EEU37002.1 hypothetical protein NECHADRAFT_52191 [Fusarium vanettenii 77-13-4]